MITNLVSITCPSCLEVFEVAAPPMDEVPCDIDYDCEVCCHPLLIHFAADHGRVSAEGHGLAE
jgi:Cysteine-rich CPXCG